MATFYDDWLRRSEENHQAVHHSPAVAKGKELRWVETPQDARAAVLIGAANGFPTQGMMLLKAEVQHRLEVTAR
jgi:hypothetical protein